MWQRNGNAAIYQAYAYADVGLREVTLDQEFFLIQLGLCTMDPQIVLSSLAARFDVLGFFREDVESQFLWRTDQIESKQLVELLESFILLIIHLVSDTATVCGWSELRVTREQVIHRLAINDLTYSEIVRHLGDRPLDKIALHPILEEVANFNQPTETKKGTYSLKPELSGEVNPYWHHYSRNNRIRATDSIREYRKRQGKSDDVILPPLIELPARGLPFSNLADFLDGPVFAGLIYYALGHCVPMMDYDRWLARIGVREGETPRLDELLDNVLTLIMIVLRRNPVPFSHASIELIQDSGTLTPFQNLWLMQQHDAFNKHRPKIDWILQLIVATLPARYSQDYRAWRSQHDLEPQKVHKSTTGAERQKQIQEEFKRKQAAATAALLEELTADEEDQYFEDEGMPSFGQCIVCQEDVTSRRPGGKLAFFQPSRVLREMVQDREWYRNALTVPADLDGTRAHIPEGPDLVDTESHTLAYPTCHHRFGVYFSSCTHAMHESCMNTYYEATRLRHTQQVQRHHPENAVRMEFVCPLCKTLCNILIPFDQTPFPPLPASAAYKNDLLPTLSQRIRAVSEECLIKIRDSARIWDHHVDTGELVPWFSDCSFSAHSLDPLYRRQPDVRPIARMVERSRNLARSLSESSQRLRGKKSHIYIPDDVVGYTVSVLEIAQREAGHKGKSVAESISETSLGLIKGMIGMLQIDLDLFYGGRFDRTPLRVGLFARFLPDWYRASALPVPILLRQPLGLVIEAAAIAPDLLHPVIMMAYLLEISRAMISISYLVKRIDHGRSSTGKSLLAEGLMPGDAAVTFFSGARNAFLNVLRSTGPFADTESVLSGVSDEVLAKLLHLYTLPFLRRASIVYYAVAGSYPNPNATLAPTQTEYSRLLDVMGLPHPVETFTESPSHEISNMVSRWLTHWAIHGRHIMALEYPGTYDLYLLPVRLEHLTQRFIEKECKKCGTVPSLPGVCLLCGKMICLGGDCCAEGEQGEANLHMRE